MPDSKGGHWTQNAKAFTASEQQQASAAKPKRSPAFTRPPDPEHGQMLAKYFELAKAQAYDLGNKTAEEKRDDFTKVISAGFRALAKDAHPDAGGSHDEMAKVNDTVDALRAGVKIVNTGEWWKQEFNDIAAQMAKHFQVNVIHALCATAIDLKKAKKSTKATEAAS